MMKPTPALQRNVLPNSEKVSLGDRPTPVQAAGTQGENLTS